MGMEAKCIVQIRWNLDNELIQRNSSNTFTCENVLYIYIHIFIYNYIKRKYITWKYKDEAGGVHKPLDWEFPTFNNPRGEFNPNKSDIDGTASPSISIYIYMIYITIK